MEEVPNLDLNNNSEFEFKNDETITEMEKVKLIFNDSIDYIPFDSNYKTPPKIASNYAYEKGDDFLSFIKSHLCLFLFVFIFGFGTIIAAIIVTKVCYGLLVSGCLSTRIAKFVSF